MTFSNATKAEVLLRLRSEFDSRHPKMRLSLITYLLEKDVKPDPEKPQEYVTMLNELISWVGENQEEFMETISGLEDVPDTTDKGVDVFKNSYL